MVMQLLECRQLRKSPVLLGNVRSFFVTILVKDVLATNSSTVPVGAKEMNDSCCTPLSTTLSEPGLLMFPRPV